MLVENGIELEHKKRQVESCLGVIAVSADAKTAESVEESDEFLAATGLLQLANGFGFNLTNSFASHFEDVTRLLPGYNCNHRPARNAA